GYGWFPLPPTGGRRLLFNGYTMPDEAKKPLIARLELPGPSAPPHHLHTHPEPLRLTRPVVKTFPVRSSNHGLSSRSTPSSCESRVISSRAKHRRISGATR